MTPTIPSAVNETTPLEDWMAGAIPKLGAADILVALQHRRAMVAVRLTDATRSARQQSLDQRQLVVLDDLIASMPPVS